MHLLLFDVFLLSLLIVCRRGFSPLAIIFDAIGLYVICRMALKWIWCVIVIAIAIVKSSSQQFYIFSSSRHFSSFLLLLFYFIRPKLWTRHVFCVFFTSTFYVNSVNTPWSHTTSIGAHRIRVHSFGPIFVWVLAYPLKVIHISSHEHLDIFSLFSLNLFGFFFCVCSVEKFLRYAFLERSLFRNIIYVFFFSSNKSNFLWFHNVVFLPLNKITNNIFRRFYLSYKRVSFYIYVFRMHPRKKKCWTECVLF